MKRSSVAFLYANSVTARMFDDVQVLHGDEADNQELKHHNTASALGG